jgi:hypothetical protein
MISIKKALIIISLTLPLFSCGAVYNFPTSPEDVTPKKVEKHGGFFSCRVKIDPKIGFSYYYYFAASVDSKLTDKGYNEIIQYNQKSDKKPDIFALDQSKYHEQVQVDECLNIPKEFDQNLTEIVYIKDGRDYLITGRFLEKNNNGSWQYTF